MKYVLSRGYISVLYQIVLICVSRFHAYFPCVLQVKQSPSSKLSDNIGTPKVGEKSDASNPQSSKKTPGRLTKIFPEEAIPDLIRLVHANSYNKIFLAKEFGAFLQKSDKHGAKSKLCLNIINRSFHSTSK